MVDVGDKPITQREAIARGLITMSRGALTAIRRRAVAKGDPLQAARLAGIMAAKQTSTLIPLCHPLMLAHVSVELEPTPHGYRIESRVRTAGQTGVEMEALTAVAVAALTIYDMVKAVDREMVIGDICLVEKTGVKQGLCTVFIRHTSASLVIQENADPDVCRDLEAYLSRLVPDGDPLFTHVAEGPDDMSAHVKSARLKRPTGASRATAVMSASMTSGIVVESSQTSISAR